ncbi:hypothetical protein KS4_09180 [Poriferisphaera corsica]|uniref:Uncharacterized protein n=1 Tax=Poriferisphaera corsica TaxID=2528020 RepID=A0A517YRM8_9BACT|nr:hypothetical protein KS4_09180 [Poriferisphaera corsica]
MLNVVEGVEVNGTVMEVGEAIEDIEGLVVVADVLSVEDHFPCSGEVILWCDL